MDINDMRVIVTVVAFACFLGICLWAYSKHAKAGFDEAARLVTGDAGATAADGVVWIQELCAELAMPGLRQFGLKEEDFPEIVAHSQRASSMKGNPLRLTDEELTAILRRVL